MNIISVFGSHNASISVKCGDQYEVIEVERFLSEKNIGLTRYYFKHNPEVIINSILSYIKEKYNVSEFDFCLFDMMEKFEGSNKKSYVHLIPAKEYQRFNHHESHAAGTFYQSSFETATIFSVDGGGNDGYFNVYTANRKDGLTLVAKEDYDFGFMYMLFGEYLKDIKYEQDLLIGNLVYAGKLMGLCSYGNVRNDWYDAFMEYYETAPMMLGRSNKIKCIKNLGNKIGVVFDKDNRLSGQIAYDIAATSQKTFEDKILQIFKKYYKDGPICFTGGCALNIILNKRIKDEISNDFFVAPNTNDCGLSLGALLNYVKPPEPFNSTYIGLPILDIQNLSLHFNDDNKTTISQLAKHLVDGMIVGCMQGRSEHGPRALGNRSILCNPCISDMKDILNSNVKNREWFRPFAPVVRLEDVNKYFHFDDESPYMSFQVQVRDEWKDKLKAITHVDGSARVQTVTPSQNRWLYQLLTEVEKLTGVGVLLNTSFNINGKPITTRISEALEIYKNTQIDGIYINGYLIKKGK